MLLSNRTTGLGWLAMLACLSLLLVSTGVSSSHAQTGEPSRTSGSFEGDGTTAGDPDMPTGDTPPPSTSGTTSTWDGGSYRGHGMTAEVTEVVPGKRFGQWAHWRIALKLFARTFIVR